MSFLMLDSRISASSALTVMPLPPIEKMARTIKNKTQTLKTQIESIESDKEKITSNDMEECHKREIGWE